ncbi:MAG: TIGR04290 family methyltransferase [Acidobacteriaceae bacterium]|nr:TIGR04290 family methyltransferase [Acidobacteriaceae bacterium]MBV8572672.1 TIGR04290 family methyltransferase [Acidobacteriaceae bacterium]
MPHHYTPEQVAQRAQELGPWFHNISLLGVATAPGHFLGDYPSSKWRNFENAIPQDLRGMTVLDVGCNGGFYSIEMKRRGADRVLGIDHDEGYLRQAQFAAEVLGLDIAFEQMSVYEVPRLNERFDLVLFMGVFYHLRYPLLALDILRQHAVKDWFVFQSMLRGSRTVPAIAQDYPFSEKAVFDHPGFPKMHFVEHSYSNDWTNWWIPNRACAEAVLRSAGFTIQSVPEQEVFVCRCDQAATLHPLPY